MPYIGRSNDFGVRNRYYYTAIGSETSLSGLDDNGRILKFTDAEYVDVYLNGVLLVDSDDYTASANTISGLTALAASDVVEIVTYDVFNVADTVQASTGGEFSGGLKAKRYQNPNTVTDNFTVATNDNAALIGPVTISSTITVNGTLTIL